MPKPDDRVLMVHDDVKDDDGKQVAVEVAYHEWEGVWKTVGWKLQPKSKEK